MSLSSLTFDYVVILAAGKGSRFYSTLPKVLHRVCGQTMLERSIRAVSPFVKKELIIVAGYGEAHINEELSRLRSSFPDIKISVAVQEEQNGTGHATKVAVDGIAENETEGRVLILPGDCPLIEAGVISEFLAGISSNPFDVLSFQPDEPKGFGRIVRDGDNFLSRIVEEKDCSPEERKIKEVNSGILAAGLSLLRKYLPKLTTANSQGEYYITDIPELMKRDGLSVGVVKSSDPYLVSGANTRLELSRLEARRRQMLLEELMREGVTIQSPDNTFIDEGVFVAKDVFIGSGTRLYGSTRIETGCVLEGDTLIKDSEIGENCLIRLGSYIDRAKLGNAVSVGPFAHLRPGSELSDGVKIGNFVELKSAKLSSGVKAGHLAYLGDVEIGAETNIGAGTIVCNYDGVKKSKTQIGSHSFVGSNSTLVSPVVIQDNSYVAAGSVITKEVPSGSLAIGRGRQQNYDGWVDKKKRKS